MAKSKILPVENRENLSLYYSDTFVCTQNNIIKCSSITSSEFSWYRIHYTIILYIMFFSILMVIMVQSYVYISIYTFYILHILCRYYLILYNNILTVAYRAVRKYIKRYLKCASTSIYAKIYT